MKKIKIIFILIAFFPIMIEAQTNNEFESQYQSFKENAISNYTSFRKKANEEYVKWMKVAWDKFRAAPAIPVPKEDLLPPIEISEEEKIKPIESRPQPVKEVPIPPLPPQPLPIEPIKEIPQTEPRYMRFDFYGIDCGIRFDEDQKAHLNSLTNDELAATWNGLVENEKYNNTIRDLLEYRIKYSLSDWAFFQLIHKMASNVMKTENEQNLITAFLLCQMGYKIRLAKNKDAFYFLFGSPHHIFDLPIFQLNNELFYAYNCQEMELEIFNCTFPGEQEISLCITKPHKFGQCSSERREIKSKRYPAVKATVSVNKNLIDFFDSYPSSTLDDNFMTRWAIYANTPLADDVKDILYPQLRELLKDKSQKDQAEILLNLVQTGFVYEYDEEVWGYDRAFFAEETLYYPYCDCEDRSILFSRLVRDILQLDVILVFYPGHLAAAVAFKEDMAGDYIELNGKKYIITDPTYIGAPIGKTMPEMNNKEAQVIKLAL